jgi:hypothetical protein
MDFYIREYIIQSPLRYGDKKVVWHFYFAGFFGGEGGKGRAAGGMNIKERNGKEGKSLYLCMFGWLIWFGWFLECNIMYDYV